MLLRRYGWNTMACQILTPGITHWFAPSGDAVVGYVPTGRTWVVAGAPVCPPEQLAATAAAFATAASQQQRRVCYFGSQERLATALAGHGPQARLLLGAQPVWNPHGWPDILARKASLRAQIARARNKSVTITSVATDLTAHMPALRRCLAEWLATCGLPPMHFLVMPDTLTTPHERRVLIAQRGDQIIAYLVITPIPQRNGWLIEQIVRGQQAPNGTAELLIDAAMRQLAAAGATYVTLGLAPLSSHAIDRERPPILIRTLLAWVRAHGNRFYNFAGLDAFKAKLQPDDWEPVYMLSAEQQTSLRTLYAITEAFCGSPPPVFLSYALMRALVQELRWVRDRLHPSRRG
jgi:phosphatidylglycerol lysyltransferase